MDTLRQLIHAAQAHAGMQTYLLRFPQETRYRMGQHMDGPTLRAITSTSRAHRHAFLDNLFAHIRLQGNVRALRAQLRATCENRREHGFPTGKCIVIQSVYIRATMFEGGPDVFDLSCAIVRALARMPRLRTVSIDVGPWAAFEEDPVDFAWRKDENGELLPRLARVTSLTVGNWISNGGGNLVADACVSGRLKHLQLLTPTDDGWIRSRFIANTVCSSMSFKLTPRGVESVGQNTNRQRLATLASGPLRHVQELHLQDLPFELRQCETLMPVVDEDSPFFDRSSRNRLTMPEMTEFAEKLETLVNVLRPLESLRKVTLNMPTIIKRYPNWHGSRVCVLTGLRLLEDLPELQRVVCTWGPNDTYTVARRGKGLRPAFYWQRWRVDGDGLTTVDYTYGENYALALYNLPSYHLSLLTPLVAQSMLTLLQARHSWDDFVPSEKDTGSDMGWFDLHLMDEETSTFLLNS